jgi:Protein of unknown function (DUF4012)
MVNATRAEATQGDGRRRRARNKRWTWRRITLIVVTVVALIFGVSAVAVAIQGLSARTALTGAIPLVNEVEDGIRAGDTETALAAAGELVEETERARSATSGPHWALMGIVPWVGPNVDAVSTTAAVIDDVSQDVLRPLIEVASTLEFASLSPVDGRVDLAPLTAAEPILTDASVAMSAAEQRMAAVDTADLVFPLTGPIEEVQTYLGRLAPLVDTGARAARLLPPMLGADGPRTYLVLFQNTAEIRSTGGMPGAFAIVMADDGRLSIEHQGTAGEVGRNFPEPVLPLPEDKQAIYTERLGRFFSGVNLAPDFPTAAVLATEMVRLSDFEVDGVVATDPTSLGYILDATGAVRVPGGEIDSDNAVETLLSDVYWELDDQGDQDDFYATTAAAIFGQVTTAVDDPAGLINALARAADERRLLVWSAHEDEQRELHETVLSGAFDDVAPSPTALGVFFNDGTSAKMQYYLETEVEHIDTVCTADDRFDTVSVTLRSTAPDDAATDFPPDVTGVGNTGVPTGSFRTNVAFYGGVSGYIRSVERDGTPVEADDHRDGNRPVRVHTTELAPGESVTFDVQFAQPTTDLPVDIWSTPTVWEGGHRGTAPAC